MTTLAAMLEASPWMAGLDVALRNRVHADVIERDAPAGHYVARRNEPAAHWIGVIDGLVKLSADASNGRTVTFTGVPPGCWFGEGSVLKDEPRRYDVIALRPSRVALMPRATFTHLLESSIPFNRFLLMQLNERLGQFIGMVEHDRLLGPEGRIARALAAMFNPVLYPSAGMRLAISQEEIGYLSGVSRQRVNQALQVLERAGVLRVDYGAIVIVDLERLRRFQD